MPTSSKNGKRNLGRTGSRWRNVRKRVLANNQICHLCGELIDPGLKYPHPMSGTVDHVIPVKTILMETGNRKDPRLFDPKNLKPAHLKCNSSKGTGETPVAHPRSRNWRE